MLLQCWRIPAVLIGGDATYPRVPEGPILAAATGKAKYPEEFLKRVHELQKDLRAADRCEIELKDGRTLERHTICLRGESDDYLGRVWFFRDISGRKQADPLSATPITRLKFF